VFFFLTLSGTQIGCNTWKEYFRRFLSIRNEGLSRLLKLRPPVVHDVHGSEMISEHWYCNVSNAIIHVCVGDWGTD